MVKWFDIIYTFKDGFNSIDDLKAAEKAADELTKAGEGDNAAKKTRGSILKDYMSSINALSQYSIEKFGNAIVICDKKSDKINNFIANVYEKIKEYKFADDDKVLPIYAYNLGSLYQYGAKCLDKRTPIRDVKVTSVEQAKEVVDNIIQVQNSNSNSLQQLVNLYYKICSDKDKLVRVTYSDIDRKIKIKNVFDNELLALPYLIKYISDVKGYRNRMLTNFYNVFLNSNTLTDKDFYDKLIEFNVNYITVDENKLKDGISFISEVFKNSEICQRFIMNRLTDKKLFEDGPAKEFCIKMKQVKCKENKNLQGALEIIIKYINPAYADQAHPSEELLNEENFNETLKIINQQLVDIVKEYTNTIVEIQQNINQFNVMLSGIVEIRNQNFINTSNSVKQCAVLWKAFYNSTLYAAWKDNFDSSIKYIANQLQSNSPEQCSFKYIISGKETDVVIINDKIGNKLPTLINITAKAENIAEYYKLFLDNDISSSKTLSIDKDIIFKVKVANIALNYLKNFFTIPYNTKVTLDKDADKTPNGYYSAACNLIYRRDLNVSESLGEEFMMFNNITILREDLEEDKTGYFKKLLDVIKDNNGDNLDQYINMTARYDDSDETRELENPEINTNDSSTNISTEDILAAADDVNTSFSNYGK